MAATYNPLALASNWVYYARLLFADTQEQRGSGPVYTIGAPLLLDEEYLGLIALHGVREGLARAARAIAATFAQKVAKYAEEGLSIEWPHQPEFYERQAADIRLNGVDAGTGGVFGGAPPLPTPETDERLRFL